MPRWLEYIFFAAYLLLGPATWVFFGIALFKGRKRMRLLYRSANELPVPAPRVTILVPAKDEGQRIGDCLESALNQDYPDYHVIAIDDRSTDCTGAVMDELAARYPAKLRVLHIPHEPLPQGWTGKCHALHAAIGQAEGQWLLFFDSDVILQPAALRATVAFGQSKQCDLVSLLPRLECHSFWESLLVPLAGVGLSAMYLVALTNHNHLPQIAFANGQYILIRRRVYEAMGGHEAVRDQFCEDIAMARLLKPQGYKVRISWAEDLAAVRMYSSLASIRRGWSRIFFAASVGRPWRILLGGLFLLLCGYSAYGALAWSIYRFAHPGMLDGWSWLAPAAAHLGLLTALLGTTYTWSGNPRRNALCFPLGAAMLLGIFAKALRMCATGRVEWRGTSYTHRMGTAASRAPADAQPR